MERITPHTYLSWKCYANSIHYSYARIQPHIEETKERVSVLDCDELVLETEEKNINEEAELAAGTKPAERKNKFLAIRVPYMSRIEIPDPREIAS